MTRRLRRWIFLPAGLCLGGMMLWGFLGLPPVGHFQGVYGLRLNELVLEQRHTLNTVTAVLFDYRSLDTLVEEFILFASVMGVALLLRPEREEIEQFPEDELPGREVPETSGAVRIIGLLFSGVLLLFGLYITCHPHISLGGGFQGGVILSTSLLMVYLASDYTVLRRISSFVQLQIAEAVGAGGFLLLGGFGLLRGSAYLENTLPLGTPGQLLSAGLIPLLSVSAGLAVGTGIVLMLNDFIEQTLIVRERRQYQRGRDAPE